MDTSLLESRSSRGSPSLVGWRRASRAAQRPRILEAKFAEQRSRHERFRSRVQHENNIKESTAGLRPCNGAGLARAGGLALVERDGRAGPHHPHEAAGIVQRARVQDCIRPPLDGGAGTAGLRPPDRDRAPAEVGGPRAWSLRLLMRKYTSREAIWRFNQILLATCSNAHAGSERKPQPIRRDSRGGTKKSNPHEKSSRSARDDARGVQATAGDPEIVGIGSQTLRGFARLPHINRKYPRSKDTAELHGDNAQRAPHGGAPAHETIRVSAVFPVFGRSVGQAARLFRYTGQQIIMGSATGGVPIPRFDTDSFLSSLQESTARRPSTSPRFSTTPKGRAAITRTWAPGRDTIRARSRAFEG